MKKRKILLGIALASAALFSLGSCGSDEEPTPTPTPVVEPSTSTTVEPEPTPDPYAEYTKIANATELLAFRNDATNKNGKFVLTADIDLEGVELDVSKVAEFAGIFDGNGHTIKNASFTPSANKTGLLFKSIVGGTVTNVRFAGCTVDGGKQQGVGLMAGLVGGGSTFTKLEFNSCTLKNVGSYGGLICGEVGETAVKEGKITISEITTKNQCKVISSSYGGFLCGDFNGEYDVTAENLYLDGTIKTDRNGSFVFGRGRKSHFTLKNSVIKASTGDESNLIWAANVDGCSCDVKNTVVISDSKLIINNNKAEGTGEKFYYTGNSENLKDGAVSVEASAVTVDWLKDTLGLDFENVWMKEGESGFRLRNSSTNIKSADATITSLTVSTANATTRFKKGQEFSTEGVVVYGTYSDGVQLLLSSNLFTIDSTAFDTNTVGSYKIKVTSTEDTSVTKEYTVTLVEQTGFKVNDEFVQKVYVKGADLALNNLRVYSSWSDEVDELLEKNEYTVDQTAYDKTAAGKYNISITNSTFAAKTFAVTVIDTKPTVVDKHVYVNVNASSNATEGTRVNGVETFTSVTNAINFLEACGYDSDVVKVVYVKEGTYHEKITTSLANLHLIGEGTNKSIISYDAVEGTFDPVGQKAYKMDCATITVSGAGFAAENIAIRNDFDYIANLESKAYADAQGFALTINADGAILNNVHLYGNQDTLYLKTGRSYFKDSKIEGNVDFIFGEPTGVAYFEGCTINAVYRGDTTNTGYVTAMKVNAATDEKNPNKPKYGYVFKNCAFTADDNVNDGSMSLGRPWGPRATVAMIDCSFTKAYSTAAYGSGSKARWDEMSGNVPTNADFAEYNSTGDGSITAAVTGGKILTAEQAATYTLANILAKSNGQVTFDATVDFAAGLTALAAEATTTAPTAITVTKDTYEIERNKTADLAFAVTPWNANAKNVEVEIGDATICSYDGTSVKGLAVGSTTITFTLGSVTKTVNITIKTPSGTNTVTFKDGTTEVKAVTGVAGDPLTFPTTTELAKDGYQFARYYLDAEFTKVFDATEIPNADTTVYLRYIDLNVANVVYVSTADELITAMGNVSSSQKTYYITADIDMTGKTYAGYTDNNNSSFYGFGYSISNWTVTNAAANTSFFGKLYAGTVDGIVFKNCSITTANSGVGILSGGLYSDETVSNITFDHCTIDGVENSGTYTYGTYIGLLAANGIIQVQNNVETTTFKNITSIGSVVKAGQYSGGLFARPNAANIVVDGFSGDIEFVSAGTANKNSGGIIGWLKNQTFTLKNASATINVSNIGGFTASDGKATCIGGVAGGLEGTNADISIDNCTLTINMTNVGSYCGGIVGQDQSGATSAFNLKDASINFVISCAKSAQNVAGVVGRLQATTTLTLNKVTLSGSITATEYDSSTKNYAAVIGNCGASAVVSLTDVSLGALTIKAAESQKANTVIANGTVNETEVTKVTYDSTKVSITSGDTAVTNLQGTDTHA